mmetsp:Transcript_14615/g.20478  ORF Transcript_14615/g.20478 Transcript_14615/m.20478 type:complete len:83 (+) Transcript_14615:106-354(+)
MHSCPSVTRTMCVFRMPQLTHCFSSENVPLKTCRLEFVQDGLGKQIEDVNIHAQESFDCIIELCAVSPHRIPGTPANLQARI